MQGALAALAAGARHWTLVSTVSVYASNDEPGAQEDAALLVPSRDGDDYRGARVAAEIASGAALGEWLLVARPGLVGGPGDGSDRFGYWVSRFALARQFVDGPVLAPRTEGRWAQIADVDDLAAWLCAAGEAGLSGVVNVTGASIPLQEALEVAARVAGYDGAVVSACDDWLLERGVGYWAGPRSLPLWLPMTDAAFAQRGTGALQASLSELGMGLSSWAATMERTLTDERSRGLNRDRRSGLARGEELALTAELA